MLVEWKAGRARGDHPASTRCQDLRGLGKLVYNVPSDISSAGGYRNSPVLPSKQGFGPLLGLWTKVGGFEKVNDRGLTPLVLLHQVLCLG